MTGSASAQTDRHYMYVDKGERGAVSLTSPSGETVVLVLSVIDGIRTVKIATPDGKAIESEGWKLTALRSSGTDQP